MGVLISLIRVLRKNQPIYKIIVKDSNFLKKPIDKIGYINLLTIPKKISINEKKLFYWLQFGAKIKNKKLFLILIKFYTNEKK